MAKFDPLDPCLHCAIARLVQFRHEHGIPDDAKDVLAKFCESIAELCATPDVQDERKELVEFCSALISAMLTDVLNMNWKTDNAGPDQTDSRH